MRRRESRSLPAHRPFVRTITCHRGDELRDAPVAYSRGPTEGAGRGPEVFSKLVRQVALAREADLDRDIGERQLIARQQSHRPSEAATDNVLARRYAGGLLEAAAEGERVQADSGGDLVPFELGVQVIVDEADGASQHSSRKSRIALRRFPAGFSCRLSDAGHDRLCQLFGAMVAPIILRGALDKVDAHHAQRVLDSAQRHCLLHSRWTSNLVPNLRVRELNPT